MRNSKALNITEAGGHVALADGVQLLIKVFDSLTPLASYWQQLQAESTYYAFQDWRWLSTWQNENSSYEQIQPFPVLLQSMDGEPLAILPLGIHTGRHLKCLTWLGGKLADYQGGIFSSKLLKALNPEDNRKLWKAVCKELPDFDATVLERQAATIGAHPNPLVFPESVTHPCNAHTSNLSGDLNTFIASKWSKNRRAQSRRKDRRLAEAGELRFVVAQNEQEIEQILPTLFRQKSRKYRELGIRDLFANAVYRNFVTNFTQTSGENSLAVLCGLYIGDQLAATVWGLVHQGRFYYLLPTYENDELSRYSPGNLLLRHLFEWCLARNITVFDFTAGDESYKGEWSDQSMALYDYLSGESYKGRLFITKEKLARLVKRRVKNSPSLFTLAKNIRIRIAQLNSH